jgi:protein SCO1/2
MHSDTPERGFWSDLVHSFTRPARFHYAKALYAVGLLLFGGCTSSSPSGPASSAEQNPTTLAGTNKVWSGMQASPLEFTNILRSFVASGIIRELPAAGDTVTIRHEEIPGFMPKMTMEFNVRDTNTLRGFKVGDVITFRVHADQQESWVDDLRLSSTNDLAKTAPSDPSSASLLHAAKMNPGDVLPDTELLSETGDTIKLSDFAGRALVFTFIFSRCPLPDFCPRMNRHFEKARQLLLHQSDAPTNWQFLSISFDPDFDRPAVLKRYAFSYRGSNDDRWLFAAAPTEVMSAMSGLLDFRFANERGSFLHNLRTVVLDTHRRVYRQFDGNKWKAEELAEALAEAAKIP